VGVFLLIIPNQQIHDHARQLRADAGDQRHGDPAVPAFGVHLVCGG